jgi:hypothetical protein
LTAASIALWLNAKPERHNLFNGWRMIHRANVDFWNDYQTLPADIRGRADKQFALLKANPQHPSLQFKKLGDRHGKEIWSALLAHCGTPFIPIYGIAILLVFQERRDVDMSLREPVVLVPASS